MFRATRFSSLCDSFYGFILKVNFHLLNFGKFIKSKSLLLNVWGWISLMNWFFCIFNQLHHCYGRVIKLNNLFKIAIFFVSILLYHTFNLYFNQCILFYYFLILCFFLDLIFSWHFEMEYFVNDYLLTYLILF